MERIGRQTNIAADDEAIARLAAEGNPEAFEQLVLRYERRVYTMVYRMVRSEEDARDLSQEVFLRVYRSIGSFQGTAKFSTWLYRIISNLCIDHIRKKRVDTVPLAVESEEEQRAIELPDERFSPERAYSRAELRAAIRAAVDGLSDEHREMFLMREIQGLSYTEIAEALGLEEGTVKSRLYRAREKLREKLVQGGNFPASFQSNEMKGGGAV